MLHTFLTALSLPPTLHERVQGLSGIVIYFQGTVVILHGHQLPIRNNKNINIILEGQIQERIKRDVNMLILWRFPQEGRN